MRKDVVGYEGLYQVDTDGNVFSLNYNRTGKERILKPGKANGYLQVVLWKDGKKKSVYVHRIVAQAFVPNQENKPQVNHINGDKLDNRPENLEWVNSSENNKHAFKIGLRRKGENHCRAKHPDSVIQRVREMNKQGYKQREIAEATGYSRGYVSKVLNDKYRKLSH